MPRIRRGSFGSQEGVSVQLFSEGGAALGRVHDRPETDTFEADGGVVFFEPDLTGAPTATVVRFASAKADEHRCDLIVDDPEGLWDGSWGRVEAT